MRSPEQRIEARGRIASAFELAQRDGPLGQALEHEEVERAPFDEVDGGVDPVVGETGAGADPTLRRHPSMMRAESRAVQDQSRVDLSC